MKFVRLVKAAGYGLLVTVLFACTAKEEEKTQTPVATAKPESKNPFAFYKNIEIKPGYHFEVLSWGKGVDTVGGYLILMSDSLKNNYRSVSVERKGKLVDAWNMDLDNDGNPELYIQYVVRQNVNDLNVFEFNANGFDKISFPGLNSEWKKTFTGDDKFYVKNGELFRTVPLQQTDSGKNAVLVKTISYRLSGNSFSSKEVKDGAGN